MSGMRIREVDTDADYQAWRQVWLAVYPHERTATVDELRARASPSRLLVVADRGGTPVGAGELTPSSLGEAASIGPSVLPHLRRQGIGSALLRRGGPSGRSGTRHR